MSGGKWTVSRSDRHYYLLREEIIYIVKKKGAYLSFKSDLSYSKIKQVGVFICEPDGVRVIRVFWLLVLIPVVHRIILENLPIWLHGRVTKKFAVKGLEVMILRNERIFTNVTFGLV